MDRLTDFLGSHWVAALLLAAAALLLVRRRSVGRVVAVALGLFAVGGLLLSGARFEAAETAIDVPFWLIVVSLGGLVVASLVLLVGRVWSFRTAAVLTGLGLLGFGAEVERTWTAGLTGAGRSLAGLHFVRPGWLVLLQFVPLVVLVARRSLGGLGPVRKWLAIGARAGVVALLALALAEPRLRQGSDSVTVLFVVDRSLSVPLDIDPALPADQQDDRRWRRVRELIDTAVRRRGPGHRDDQAGVILFGKRPKLILPPAAVDRLDVQERMAGALDGQYTDIAAALKLALASFPEGTGKRVVLVSDGNENIGSAEEVAAVARQNGVEIDTVALAPGYRNESEVLVQSVEAPPVTTVGARLPVRVLVRNASPDRVVVGLLELKKTGRDADEGVEIEDSSLVLEKPRAGEKKPALVRLLPGLNRFLFRDRAETRGDSAFSYRATFVPLRSADESGRAVAEGVPGDRPANNQASAAVVSRGQRRVLFLDATARRNDSPHQFLIDTLRRSRLRIDHLPVGELPPDRDDLGVFLNNFDCVVIANAPAESFSGDQMETLRAAVHDQGCGLVMVGGRDAFGPGGYQGTPVEAALPVDCEIKNLKAAGKGGLVLIMHASEMADGNKWQKEIAKLAVKRLNDVDMVGVAQYGFGNGGVSWVVPFQDVGSDRGRLMGAIDGMTPGDMPHFDPFLQAATDTLAEPKHNLAVKHALIISDGDPLLFAAGRAALQKMATNGITCSTVGVATHSAAEGQRMREIAATTRDGRGNPGSYYEPKSGEELPAIYIKESRRISQSFVYDRAFAPQLRLADGPAEGLPRDLPTLHGFVRTTKKESPLAQLLIEGPRVQDQRFPVLAAWRYGLGKGVAYTSEALAVPNTVSKNWDRDWAGSDMYTKFWEQVVTWAMREAEKGKLTVRTEYRDGRVRVSVETRDDKDRPVTGLDVVGKVSLPRAPAAGERVPALDFKRRGPGRYEAEFPAEEAGSYFVYVQGLEGKNAVFDAARSGVTVPYSPEFSDLESNTPLLKRLSDATGGRHRPDDPETLTALAESGDLFRDAPKTVRAITPIWFWLVFAAGVLLLFDVGVRRVAVEWAEVERGAATVWAKLRAKPEADEATPGLGQLLRRKQQVEEAIDRERSARRFEPTDTAGMNPAARQAPAGADDFAKGTPTVTLPPPPPPREQPTPAADKDDTFAKLQRAKRRAQRNMDRRDAEPR